MLCIYIFIFFIWGQTVCDFFLYFLKYIILFLLLRLLFYFLNLNCSIASAKKLLFYHSFPFFFFILFYAILSDVKCRRIKTIYVYVYNTKRAPRTLDAKYSNERKRSVKNCWAKRYSAWMLENPCVTIYMLKGLVKYKKKMLKSWIIKCNKNKKYFKKDKFTIWVSLKYLRFNIIDKNVNQLFYLEKKI